jgi:hypothetical protein
MTDQGSEGLLSPYLRNKRINTAKHIYLGGCLILVVARASWPLLFRVTNT